MLSRKTIFNKIDESWLRFPFYLVYVIAAKVSCRILGLTGSNVWIRNSYYLNNLVVGISDLDFSIQFETVPTSIQIDKLKRSHKLLKFLFPFLGEMNIYIKYLEAEVIPFFNKLEMMRDPYLLKILNMKPIEIRESEKLTFLLRMLEADKVNLKECPEFRQKKWKSHFNAVGEDFNGIIQKDDILNLILKLVPNNMDKYKESINNVIETGEFDFLESRENIILFPHRWAVWVNINGGLKEGLEKLSLSIEEREIVIEMLRWEIMGIYTQLFLLEEEQNVKFYLKLINEFASLIKAEKDLNTDQLISYL